jgi:hypothetical protein
MTQGEEGMREIFGGDWNDNMASNLDYIMNDPRKTNEEIKDLLENIKPDMDLAPENRDDTPEGMKYPLVSIIALSCTPVTNLRITV